MNSLTRLIAIGFAAFLSVGNAIGQDQQSPTVRIAELTIDPAQLDEYKAIVKKEMEISVRTEPGVIAIYAVSEKDEPSKLRFFEIYADEVSYRSHLASPHFREYVEATKNMIIDRRLIETVPVQLGAKPR